jgi:uncharacterized Ntn-hydrolase superfamily protein
MTPGLRSCSYAAAALVAAAGLAAGAPDRAEATWSIVAVDRGTGSMGVASASCVDYDLRAIAHVQPRIAPFRGRPARPARGALVVQAAFEPANWARAGRLLESGLAPAGIVGRLADPASDPRAAERQYGVVGADGRVATYTGAATVGWSGARTARGLAVLGNYLSGPRVVARAFAAYRALRSRPFERRLMAALLAGARAGGDNRCGPTRATSAAIVAQTPRRFTAVSAITWPPGARNAVAALDRKLRRALARSGGVVVDLPRR